MITAALTGKLHDAPHGPHPIFRIDVPQRCPDVPAEVLNPRNTWADKDAYDHKAAELAQRFEKNFARFESAPSEVRGAGPRVD
jgi:phosphoenolpyruvate carboxykinase (ATP)